MVAGDGAHGAGSMAAVRRFPPIAEMAVGSMALVVIGGIYIAAYLPKVAPLAPAIGLLILSMAVLGAAVFSLTRLHPFAWDRFRLVGRYTLMAYLVVAGMLEYVFVVDGTRGGTLLVMTLMLAIFAVDVPLVLAFTVARYTEAGDR